MALEPITRQEKIIAGQDLTPITRMEKFLKNFGGGGGSIPKPLTYDYMPEGYPSKSVGNVTLMEEQEVTFSNMGGFFGAVAPVKIDISDGQTYTIVWDGVEYSCVGHASNGAGYIGNPAALGAESTGEPFLYTNLETYMWAAYDTATSHTIKVTDSKAIYTPMDANFIPVATENTYGAVKTSDFIKMVTLEGKMDKETVYKYAKEFEDGKIRLRLVNGNFIYDISSIIRYGAYGGVEIFDVTTEDAPYRTLRFTCGSDGQYDFSLRPSNSYTSSVAYLQDIWLHSNDDTNNTSAKITVSAKGKRADGMFLDVGCKGIIVESSTSGSTKEFKITVDDSGIISATEVT